MFRIAGGVKGVLTSMARVMLYYLKSGFAMPHQHALHAHPAVPPAFSLLRLSALQRLAVVAPAIAAIWLAVYWALQ